MKETTELASGWGRWRVLVFSLLITFMLTGFLVFAKEWLLSFLILFTQLSVLPFIFVPGFQTGSRFENDRRPVIFFLVFAVVISLVTGVSFLVREESQALAWREVGNTALTTLREYFLVLSVISIFFAIVGIAICQRKQNAGN